MKDREFDTSDKVLNGKAIELQEQGSGKRRHRANCVTEEEEELLWSGQVLGADTALNLNLIVFHLISQQFGTRGCQGHHQLRVEHLMAFVLAPLSMLSELKDLQKQGKQDLEKSIGGSHRGCLLHQIQGAQ